MEDIRKFESFYSWVDSLWNISAALIILRCLIPIFTGSDCADVLTGLAIISATIFIWWFGRLVIRLERILLTRIVAMTENVLEITKMLEKRFGEGDDANDGKGETE